MREQKNPSMLDLNKENYDIFGLVFFHVANIDIKIKDRNDTDYRVVIESPNFQGRGMGMGSIPQTH